MAEPAQAADLQRGRGLRRELTQVIDQHFPGMETVVGTTRERGQTGERRAQAAHSTRTIPHLEAGAPSLVWSWDITNNVTRLLAILGNNQSHSRPRVSNDNPYSEAAFKTLKYCPAFPERFGCIEDARLFCEQFFDYYNNHHRHSGIGMHTPTTVHDGTAIAIQARRVATLNTAFLAHPKRFRGRRPYPPPLPTRAWINKPSATLQTDDSP